MQILKNQAHVVQESIIIVCFAALESSLSPDWLDTSRAFSGLDLESRLFLGEDPTAETHTNPSSLCHLCLGSSQVPPSSLFEIIINGQQG